MRDRAEDQLDEWREKLEEKKRGWREETGEVPEHAVREYSDAIKFVEWLDNQEHIFDIRPRTRGIDFKIGEHGVWPEYSNDDHLNAINSSSISMFVATVPDIEAYRYINEAKIHLPAAPEELREEIDTSLDLPEDMAVHYGTGALGGMPAPDGVVTPHILQTDKLTYSDVQQAVEQALDVYVTVYEEGTKAIKQQPEEYR